MNAALHLLGYNDRNTTIFAAISDPMLELVIDQVLQALSGQKCWATLPPTANVPKNVWAQMAMFYQVMIDNPAGTVLNILVLAIGVVVVYVLVKRMRGRLTIALQSPRVNEFVTSVEEFLNALRPNNEVPLLPDVPTTPVPSPLPDSRPPTPSQTPPVVPPVVDGSASAQMRDRTTTPRGSSARSSVAPMGAAVSAPNLYPDLAAALQDSMEDFQSYRPPRRAISTTDEEVRFG